MLRIVVLNGGRGAGTLISALLERRGLNVTSVVNAYDDGKSTGEIRRFFGMLGPSDIRKVQELMLPKDDPEYQVNLRLFQYRYPENSNREAVLAELHRFSSGENGAIVGIALQSRRVRTEVQRFVREFVVGLNLIERVRGTLFSFADCSLMNCVYAGAFLAFRRNLEKTAQAIDRLFKLQGVVLPNSIENKTLVAMRENGEMLYSEAEIVELRSNVRIERVYLLDHPLDRVSFEKLCLREKKTYLAKHHCCIEISNGVRLALKHADIVIYAAGTQHSSLYPTYLSSGLAQSIADNRSALKVFITNIGADYETPSYQASDFIRGAFRYLNLSDSRDYKIQELFDVVMVNRSNVKAYETYVTYDEKGFVDIPTRRVVDNFESVSMPGRHDGQKLVDSILEQYELAGFSVNKE